MTLSLNSGELVFVHLRSLGGGGGLLFFLRFQASRNCVCVAICGYNLSTLHTSRLACFLLSSLPYSDNNSVIELNDSVEWNSKDSAMGAITQLDMPRCAILGSLAMPRIATLYECGHYPYAADQLAVLCITLVEYLSSLSVMRQAPSSLVSALSSDLLNIPLAENEPLSPKADR